jgi:SAM-dependent methyltransferase
MYVLQSQFPNWRHLRIHESSPGPVAISQKLSKECERYIATQYFPSCELGSYSGSDNIRNEDLHCQTFGDGEFDIVITQDVFEHLFFPNRAISEISRTLAENGAHIATVPLVRGGLHSLRRAILDERGRVVHLRAANYHQNPIDDYGSLVTVDWGFDIAIYFDNHSELKTTIFSYERADLGIRGGTLRGLIQQEVLIF